MTMQPLKIGTDRVDETCYSARIEENELNQLIAQAVADAVGVQLRGDGVSIGQRCAHNDLTAFLDLLPCNPGVCRPIDCIEGAPAGDLVNCGEILELVPIHPDRIKIELPAAGNSRNRVIFDASGVRDAGLARPRGPSRIGKRSVSPGIYRHGQDAEIPSTVPGAGAGLRRHEGPGAEPTSQALNAINAVANLPILLYHETSR